MRFFTIAVLFVFQISLLIPNLSSQSIPLAEHPRPDFEREQWQNLNGDWSFAFDSTGAGMAGNWSAGKTTFPHTISVPFPWGSKLSGVEDLADIGWYQRSIQVDASWQDKRTFITIGASDWETTVWLDGQLLGSHQGGYVPFSFELTEHLRYGQSQQLVIKADDARRDFTLYGKQGYGNARGIWQTVYLEARGSDYLEALHFSPDIDQQIVTVTAYLPQATERDLPLTVTIKNASIPLRQEVVIPKGNYKFGFDIPIASPRLWDLDNPFLYEVEATLEEDKVNAYFGMRKISVMDLPGTDFPYIALNDQPVYLQLALDQSYHPEGFYTFPSDQFMREEIERSKSIGLNGIRTHIKVEVPRKLYWADKLGLLVMEDLPNSWGEPDALAQAESTYTLKEMIKRDYNHPSIFSWIVFNETWGLTTDPDGEGPRRGEYLAATQDWAASMYYLAKSLDQTRLVEDNSICCGFGHTETDINSWHAYLPGWAWEAHLKNLTDSTYAGSPFDFEDGFYQGSQPNINSECGNVWGYEGSTGDVDWSWDYHRMINTFRKYPKVAGWLYTEHHDVINEWNGYWRFDRSEKETGLDEIFPGMSLNDLHSTVYLSTGDEICRTVQGGAKVKVPLYLSVMTGADLGTDLNIYWEVLTTNYLGEMEKSSEGTRPVLYQPWMQQELEPLSIELPNVAGLALLKLTVTDSADADLHRNLMHFEIQSDQEVEKTQVLSVAAKDFTKAEWSKKQWNILEGKKVNGAGKGYFEYTIAIPKDTKAKKANFQVELSAKELFVKDQKEFDRDQNYMRGSVVAPSSNPNSYPMSDETMYPSQVSIWINGTKMHTTTLADDPADHRGVLSWHHQLKDRKLREAGSYGYLVQVPINKKMLRELVEKGEMVVRIQAEGEGGVAVYGREFGRYPVDPGLVLKN